MVRQTIEIITKIQNELEESQEPSGRGTNGLSAKTIKKRERRYRIPTPP